MIKDPISITHPELAAEWSERNAPITADMVSCGSHDIVWWKGRCGHEWQASVNNRTSGCGCPYCSNRKILKGFNDFATVHPELLSEWSEKNAPLTPDMFSVCSNKKVVWHGKCGHEWTASIAERSKGHGCPICANTQILAGYNDIASKNPKMAAEWSDRNLPLTPDRIYFRAVRKYWWHCDVCGNDYFNSPAQRLRYSSGCPYCRGRELKKGQNDLTKTHPDIAEEWDYERNEGLTPDMYLFTSRKYVSWKCRYGHSYGRMIQDRAIEGKGCVVCEAEYRTLMPLLPVIRCMSSAGYRAAVGCTKAEYCFEILYEDIGLAFEYERFSLHSRTIQQEKKLICAEKGIRLEILQRPKNTDEAKDRIFEIMRQYGIEPRCSPDETLLREDFFRTKDRIMKNKDERETEPMNDEMKLLLKLLLAQEEETEAGQKVTGKKKRLAPEPASGIDYPPEEKPVLHTEKEFRDNDFSNARHEMYPDHANNVSGLKGVPIWEKYALTVPEAAAYFHIGETRLRKLVKKDRYANYLFWNGGRVFIKRKLFEEYLNGENELL